MPYIKQDRRGAIDSGETPMTTGELNYAITAICMDFVRLWNGKKSYDILNDVIGALECAKLECYRRVLSPLEDEKRIQNGDVY